MADLLHDRPHFACQSAASGRPDVKGIPQFSSCSGFAREWHRHRRRACTRACTVGVHFARERQLETQQLAAFVGWYCVANHSQLTPLTRMQQLQGEIAVLPSSGGAQAPWCDVVATSSIIEPVLIQRDPACSPTVTPFAMHYQAAWWPCRIHSVTSTAPFRTVVCTPPEGLHCCSWLWAGRAAARAC